MESLASQIQAVLKECPYVRSYQFSVMEFSDVVVIRGIVFSYHHKQMAQETISQFLKRSGKKKLMLKNEIEVLPNWGKN